MRSTRRAVDEDEPRLAKQKKTVASCEFVSGSWTAETSSEHSDTPVIYDLQITYHKDQIHRKMISYEYIFIKFRHKSFYQYYWIPACAETTGSVDVLSSTTILSASL